jgi:cytochrome bd-type quinol oxidase subunit 1
MATTDTTTVAVIDNAELDEDQSTGSEIAHTLAVGATTTVAVAGVVLAYHYLKPKVVARIRRNRNSDPMVIDGEVITETLETEKV